MITAASTTERESQARGDRRYPSLRGNLVANFVGRGCNAVIGIAFPPIIARLLGIESYGLIGIYASLNAAFAIFDLGLTATMTRQMARLSDETTARAASQMRDMARSFELVSWCVGIVVGACVFTTAPLVASHWVHAQSLQPDAITSSVRLIGLVLCLQWPSGMYNGGLLGMQRQVLANMIQVTGTATKFAGGALVLWKFTPTVQAFFLWQAAVAGLQTIATAIALGLTLPPAAHRGNFRKDVLLDNWRYSAGSSLTTVLAMILTQVDKFVVSKLLTLAAFGYYTLAYTMGNGLSVLVGPVFVAVFPRLAQLVRADNTPEVARLYHVSSQLVSVALLPAAGVLVLFSREVIWSWTGDAASVDRIQPILIAVAIGTALNGLMNVPYALQLAYGWTSIGAWTNGIAVLIIVPLTFVLARAYGTVGAATGWAVLNCGYVIFNVHAMHRRLLRHEMRQWYVVDVGLPLLGAFGGLLPIRLLFHSPASRLSALLLVGFAAFASMAAAALFSSTIRGVAVNQARLMRRKLCT